MADDILKERIQERLDALGKKARKASIEAGMSGDGIRNLLRDKANTPRVQNLKSLAKVLKCTGDYLLGDSDELGVPQEPSTLNITIDDKQKPIHPPHINRILKSGTVRSRTKNGKTKRKRKGGVMDDTALTELFDYIEENWSRKKIAKEFFSRLGFSKRNQRKSLT